MNVTSFNRMLWRGVVEDEGRSGSEDIDGRESIDGASISLF